ncbi:MULTISPECIES: tripartite tricarboxylate transporter substrate-binding protein [unclassified Beijerinckia]|uniref:Bug family tripartite tricarboxylate transporter substrate binding protein n=1 Tax=unclassified Beijerinckia TaxID=2638183 RepID=UPI00089782CA|nr:MULTISPECIES: tripartite tricarboxylate transporter substrate-binding protein [unclassified Beijerinckia]MDH7795137.1 tripartite-type tricarboxylate transporter receptor subunit TctC [Beijerinckia sp. GAS462]SEB89127.1 Tripartite-type tricarboxylate transporter, receptor component TctC [Beijerinckia sp. 28-YEA-48]
MKGTVLFTPARTALLIASVCAFAAGTAAQAQPEDVAAFYKGKTLTIQVGYGPGGGYDMTARVVSQFYGKHIPGKPTVVVQNAPGGGSLRVANSIYNAAAKDGLTLGVFAFDVALQPYYGEKGAMFDPSKFAWIGSMDTDNQYCGVWKGAGVDIKNLPDLVASKKTISFGSSAPGAVPSVYPLFFKNALGAPLKVINGYTGTKDIMLAMQRGEVDGTCGLFESSLRSAYMDDIKGGSLQLIMQSSTEQASPLFPSATPIMSAMKSDEMRRAARLVFDPAKITRPLAAPPGTPDERVKALRQALADTLSDPEALEAGKKMMMNLELKTAKEIDGVLAEFRAASPDLLKQVYAITHE